MRKAALLIAFLLAGCGPPAAPPSAARSTPRDTPAGPLVAFLGDSLTAGWNLEEHEAYPALLQKRLLAAGYPIRAVNAGVSGDTAAGGLRRLDWILTQKPDIVVVALGANDGLRGLPLEAMEASLRQILLDLRRNGVRALLVGIKIPPSMGPEYARRFEEVYVRLARELEVPLVPFLMEGVAGRDDILFPDGIHPKAAGHERMAANVLPLLWEMLAGRPQSSPRR